MKKLICCALCLCVLLSALPISLADSTPLIYKVTDENGNYIFLLGTMHVIDEDTLPIARFEELMDQVDTAVFELDAEFFEALLASEDVSRAETIASARRDEPNALSDELIERLVTFFGEECGYDGIDADMLRHVSAYGLYQLTIVEVMRLSGLDVSGAAVDKYVYREAVRRGMRVIGAETIEEQTDALAEYLGTSLLNEDGEIEEGQFYLLLDNRAMLKYSLSSLVTSYNTGNLNFLMMLLVRSYPRTDVDAARNQRFFDAALARLDEGGRAVIAVGLYHVLAEEDGLVTRLTEAGCTVEQW